ncbi:annexin A2 [Hoplias malabaricus]|uniref:annexin A2 n=1 Tax=Hoplias malabaricus TaxID=27720 RepID=UPI00346382D0
METSLRPKEMLNWGTLGSVRPFPEFTAEKDVVEFQDALEKKDIQTVLRVLTGRSNAQRQTLAHTYQTKTQQDLNSILKKVLSRREDVETLVLSLMMKTEGLEAQRLRLAMKGLGTDEETLLEILCVRTPLQLSKIKTVYNEEFKRDLESDLISETSGDFTKLLLALLKKAYLHGNLEQDVTVLRMEMLSKKADATQWIRIFTSRAPAHLRKVLIELEVEQGRSVADIIDTRFGGIFAADFRLGLHTLVQCIENPYLYLAQRIQKMNVSVLLGVMVSHAEEDLLAVRTAFKRQTGTSLYTTLQERFKGDLQQGLLALCRSED